jgi:hypothetical protein
MRAISAAGYFFADIVAKQPLPWLYSGGEFTMTKTQKEKIELMRSNGDTCANIAVCLGLSANTVKSYCARNSIGGKTKSSKKKPACAFCKKIMPVSSQPSRRFCSFECRMAWWNAHPKEVNRKAIYHFTCPVCHKPFTAYGNAHRKYCSRKCYGKSKKAVAK